MKPVWPEFNTFTSKQTLRFPRLPARPGFRAPKSTGSSRKTVVPARSEFPYVTFGQSVERDWSTGTEDGKEHVVTLHVWSRARGRKESDDILEAARAALQDAALAPGGHHLVNFRHEFSDVRRDPDGETFHGIARFRAVTEPM